MEQAIIAAVASFGLLVTVGVARHLMTLWRKQDEWFKGRDSAMRVIEACVSERDAAREELLGEAPRACDVLDDTERELVDLIRALTRTVPKMHPGDIGLPHVDGVEVPARVADLLQPDRDGFYACTGCGASSALIAEGYCSVECFEINMRLRHGQFIEGGRYVEETPGRRKSI